MKIHQLPMGARFEFEGEEYVKTGPMFASGKSGQRLIPKYAILKPIGPVPTVVTAAPRKHLPRNEVLTAFEAFHDVCRGLLPPVHHAALGAARAAFLKAIGE